MKAFEEEVFLEDYFEECQSDDTYYINDWVGSGWTGTINLDLILSYGIKEGASDIHLVGGQMVSFTVLGDIVRKPRFSIPDEDIMNDIVLGILSHQARGNYIKDLEYDFSYKIRFGPYKGRRFRANLGKSLGLDQITFRTISDEIPTTGSLGLEEDILELFQNSSGVVLICGATGSGKSTSLAAILRENQMNRKLKIITVEKPIEYVYPTDGQSLIVQRAIPEDCLDFSSGLTSAMRSAPDIIMIGEVRNKEEVDELLRAAETGHLAVSTIHTANNVTTINRIRSLYEGEEQRRILSTLGDTLRGIMNQTLVKTSDGKGRFAVREFIRIDYRIRKLIAEDNVAAIRKLQEDSESTMEHKLAMAVIEGRCIVKDAREKAPDQIYFDEILLLYKERYGTSRIKENYTYKENSIVKLVNQVESEVKVVPQPVSQVETENVRAGLSGIRKRRLVSNVPLPNTFNLGNYSEEDDDTLSLLDEL